MNIDRFVRSTEVAKRICEVLGIDPKTARRVVISLDSSFDAGDEKVMIYVQKYLLGSQVDGFVEALQVDATKQVAVPCGAEIRIDDHAKVFMQPKNST